ncbi:ROK family protein [Rapidithrix thailandica]|uniref:ROK family protein n=1 Tax=Rapidithrix thailandica TaxID=413964 RepID=A0AAW9S4J0_9BACT
MNLQSTFFEELKNEDVGGVAYKNLSLKKKILDYFANIGNATITDLSKALTTSTPKINNLILELIEAGLVEDFGKVESSVGRRPNMYGLSPDSVFFIGVEVKKNYVNIGLINFQKDLVKTTKDIPYALGNHPSSLESLCEIINHFIKNLHIDTKKILGLGINLSGRIDYKTGHSYSYFHFNEQPLTQVIQEKTNIPTFLENDSRAMAYGEFTCGIVQEEKNVLFVNIDHGIGLGMMIEGELYYGKSGFSGEFGHIPLYNNEILCHCGKKGCLETEASGKALLQVFKQKVKNGATSIVTQNHKKLEDIKLEDIIQAANNDDILSIELIAQIGEKLGKGIALLINLFNPELVILGGILSSTGDYIYLPIKSAINKYSLSKVSNDTELKISQLGDNAGILGACLLVRNKLLN